jgi:predicted ABC-type ATPase
MPILYIIAGPNGAGKTTTAQKILPNDLKVVEFVNADNIAKGLSPFNPEGVAFEAGRIMLKRIKELAEQKIDFAFETTLSTLSYVSFIKDCKKKGYEVVLIFVWLNSIELAKKRVMMRVRMGGHNIEESIIKRRYKKGIKNLTEKFLSICDEWLICDNSEKEIELISKYSKGDLQIFNQQKHKIFFKK